MIKISKYSDVQERSEKCCFW